MLIRPLPVAALVTAALHLAACGATTEASPTAAPDQRPPAVDPARSQRPDPDPSPVPDGRRPQEVALVADFGPLPDGSGNAVVETTWTTAADGTVRVAIDTPAGLAEQHVITADEHWWWLHPEVRRTIADAEWVHFDLGAIEEVGGELPDVVTEARQPAPQPHDVTVGQVVAGREVLAVEVVDADEVLLTVAGIDRPVVHRRRALPEGTTVDIPAGAVDVGDLPDRLRW